jgi:hypothetical protein
MRKKPFLLSVILGFGAAVPAVRSAEPGTIVVVAEAPVRLDFTIGTGVPYKFDYPTDRVKLWDSPDRTTEIPSGTTFTSTGQRLLGDATGDGSVRLTDLIVIANRLGSTSALGCDLDQDGVVGPPDLVLCRNAMGTGPSTTTVTVYADGLAASTALGDTSVQLLVDADGDGAFAPLVVTALTVVNVSIAPTSGPIGTLVTVTIQPAVSPLAFDADTTATWAGSLYPHGDPPGNPLTVDYDASQLHELSAEQASFVLGDGDLTGGEFGQPPLEGRLDGAVTLHFAGTNVTRSHSFTVEPAWGFVDGGGGGAGAPVDTLYILRPSDPAWGDYVTLESCKANQYLLTLLPAKNAQSQSVAPQDLLVDLISYSGAGVEIGRTGVWMFLAGRDDFGADFLVYYSNWQRPIVFVDEYVDPALHPTLTIVTVDPDGWIDVSF